MKGLEGGAFRFYQTKCYEKICRQIQNRVTSSKGVELCA